MAYYPDLSFYRYDDIPWLFKSGYPYVLLNVGWLDGSKDFPTGELKDKDGVLYYIFRLCQHRLNLYRGKHTCDLCSPPSDSSTEATHLDNPFSVGNGAIFVRGRNNLLYIAPTMIFHYIKDHNYLPPEEFIEALSSDRLEWDHFQKLQKTEES